MARTRYRSSQEQIPLRKLPAAALRAVLHEGYDAAAFRSDLMAGAVVGVVALPLSMALAIAVGAPPQHGLYTAIIGGVVIALLGGSRTQVSGPTAAFIVILAPITAKFGLGGLLLAGLLAGLILIMLALLRLGKLIQYIPHPVTTGFTAGIGTVIAVLQLKDFFGLELQGSSAHFFERLGAMYAARGTLSVNEAVIGTLTLALLLLAPRATRKVPAPLIALPAAAVLAYLGERFLPDFHVATIATRFQTVVGDRIVHGIPRLPPLPMLPWAAGGASGGAFTLDLATLQALLPGAFAIAMLGAIESLLSAVVADGMVRTRHDPDAELLALGVGNVITPFFGGIPATGAIARTATNIRSGGRSPVAAMIHAVVVLLAVLALAPLVGYLPMTSLAALLLLVAWNMSEAKHFGHTIKVAPKSDVAVLLTCYGLTVAFDMVVAVTAGIVLAALLFMRRMVEVTEARIAEAGTLELPRALPEGVFVYDIGGPLFFGAAQKAMGALGVVGEKARVLILRLENVPVMDATGLVALESALAELDRRKVPVILASVRPQPRKVMERARLPERYRTVRFCPDMDCAIAAAEAFVTEGGGAERQTDGALLSRSG